MAEDIKVIINTLLADEDFLKGVGKIKTGFKEAEKSSKGFFDTIKAKYIAAAAAIGGLIKVIKDSVQAYAEEEKAQRLLQAAFQKTHENAGELTKDFAKWASEMQKVTSFGDEVTVMAAAQLEALTGLSGEGLKKATKAAMDFSVAMGVDIQTAASLIGKTISSSTNALARYGIELKDGGTQSERFANLMDTLNKKFGGFAEKEGASAAGRLAIIKNQFSDLQEVIGKEAFPVLESFLKVFSVLMVSFQNAPDAFKKVGLAAAGLTALLIPLGVALGPIGLIAAALMAAGTAFVYFYNRPQGDAKAFQEKMVELSVTMMDIQKNMSKIETDAFAKGMKKSAESTKDLQTALDKENISVRKSEENIRKLTELYETYAKNYAEDVKGRSKAADVKLGALKKEIEAESKSLAERRGFSEAYKQILTDRNNAEKEAAEKEKKREEAKNTKILEIRKKVLQAEKTLDLETIEGKKEIVKMIDELIEAYEGNEAAIGGLMEIKKEYIALIELEEKALIEEEKGIKNAANAMTIYGAASNAVTEVISAIDENSGKAVSSVFKLVGVLNKMANGDIAGGIADIVTELGRLIAVVLNIEKVNEIDWTGAKKIKNDMKMLKYEVKQMKYENEIAQLENLKKSMFEYYDAITEEEKNYNTYLEQKEKDRISNLRGEERQEAELKMAAEKSRLSREKAKAEDEKDINAEILKYKIKQAEVEKKINILKLKIDKEAALSEIVKVYYGHPEEIQARKSELTAIYDDLIAAIMAAPLPAYGYGGRPTPGQPAIVGERGAELFVPDQAGVILSNDMLRGLRFPVGGNSNTYNNNNPVSISGNQFQLNTNNSQELWKQLLKMADNTNSRLLRR